jgi:hypothetical protein
MPSPHTPDPGEVVYQARRLQAVVLAVATRTVELAIQPDQRVQVMSLLDAATQLLTLLGDRLGSPAAVPSIDLVVARPEGLVQSFGRVTLHNALDRDEAMCIHLDHLGLTITAGRVEDGRPFIRIDSADVDWADQAPHGLPYIDVDLDEVPLYEHRPDLPVPRHYQPAATPAEGA